MSYLTQSRLATDDQLLIRVAACAASLGHANPSVLAGRHAWAWSAQPGWVDAYAKAEAEHAAAPDEVPPPGANESAITDQMILAAVALLSVAPDESPA